MNLPEWWIGASGVFFIVGTLAVFALIVLAIVLIQLALELRAQIKTLTSKVEILTDKTTIIAEQIKDVTQDVSMRTKGIVKVVDDNASTAFGIIEKIAPAMVVAGLGFRLFRMLGSKRRSR